MNDLLRSIPRDKSPLLVFSLALLFFLSFVTAGSTETVYTVTNTNDSGDNSLRKVIELANGNPGHDIIRFNIPGNAFQDRYIDVYSSLIVLDAVTIEGPNQDQGPIVLNGRSASATTAYTGIQINASDCTIRGLRIGNFSGRGISVSNAENTVIKGNQIGAFLMTGNQSHGISLFQATKTMIGGPTAADRNFISGNGEDSFGNGIDIYQGGNNTIQGNYIGVNITGTAAVRNVANGIYIYSSNGNIIGGSAEGAGNVISGHDSSSGGIVLSNSSGTTIQGNRIGTNAAGTAALPNINGIITYCSSSSIDNTTIGGQEPGMGNLISGNSKAGIHFQAGSTGENNRMLGNTIGTNAEKNAAIPNGSGVIVSSGESGVAIGGTASGAGNLISGNTGQGIYLSNETTKNTVVQGNRIGTDGTGAGPLGNGTDGIYIERALGSTIGGTASGAANIIAYNGRSGVQLVYGDSPAPQVRKNAIRGNAIYGNAALGIDFSIDGVTPNDSGDPDTGPNELQNFPVLTGLQANGEQIRISGTLNSLPGKTYDLDFFAGEFCDPSGCGQGERYLGSVQATTDSGGNVSFQTTLGARLTGSGIVTATATDPDGNTSEFSFCYPYTVNAGSCLSGVLMLLLQD
jgi:hypothetical protein